ncbi:MAG: hypothetical protein AB3N23_09335 [Paracoccaceae bacterium]
MFKQFMSALVVLCMPINLLAQTPGPELRDRADAVAAEWRRAAEQISQGLYDPAAKADDLFFDPSEAVKFVAEEIAFDPYVGVLRGPRGTLSAEAGSAWDQAVLLASLLNEMAVEAMIVEGDLPHEDATRLLTNAIADPAAVPEAALTRDDILTLLSAEAADVPEAQPGAILSETQSRELVAPLQDAAAQFGRMNTNVGPLIDGLARNYAWVRWRETPSDPWREVHPAFGTEPAPEAVARGFIDGVVPEDMTHQVTVELLVERREGGNLRTEPLISLFKRPAALLADRQIMLSVGPAIAGGTDIFLPVLNGVVPDGAKAFGLNGLTASAEDALAGPDIFRTVGNKLGDVIGGLGGEEDAPALSALILIVTTSGPGHKPRTEIRRLTDFSEGVPEDAASLISFDGVIDVAVGVENGARRTAAVLRSQANRFRASPWLGAAMREEISFENLSTQPAAFTDTLEMPWMDMALFGDVLRAPAVQGALLRPGPMVTMRRSRASALENGLTVVEMDVLHAPVLGLRLQDGAPELAPDLALRDGVRLTALEQSLTNIAGEDLWIGQTLGEVLTDRPALEAWLQSNPVSNRQSLRMQDDLKQGRILVMAGQGDMWWRIDPVTGETLGMSAAAGGPATEKIQKITGIAMVLIGGIAAFYGAYSCHEAYPDDDEMLACCQLGNIALYGVGAASGNKLASVAELSTATATGYVLSALTFESFIDLSGYSVGLLSDPVCKWALDR